MAKQLLIIGGEKGRMSNRQTFLGPKGILIYIADTVREGLELLRSLRIDGVVLRLDRLERTDFGVLNDLQAQYPHIPLMAISGKSSRNVESDSFVVTVKGYLSNLMIHEHSQEVWFIFEGHLN